MTLSQIPDQAFCLRGPDGEPEWKAIVGGVVIAASFNSRGAAEAAIPVERARQEQGETSKRYCRCPTCRLVVSVRDGKFSQHGMLSRTGRWETCPGPITDPAKTEEQR